LQMLAEVAREEDRATPPALREVITAGEQLQITPAVVRFFGAAADGPVLLDNQYGPSECHVVTAEMLPSSPRRGGPEAWPTLPAIGRPIADTAIRLVDAAFRPVPVGVAGELLIGGAPLARGYLGRPARTAGAFVPDPFAGPAAAGGRLYRTGDLARWLPDGGIEFLGRRDTQVKVRGFRVEPGEVEAALAAHSAVREAAVVVQDAPAGRRLVAWVTTGGAAVAPSEILAELRRTLPEYMVPAALEAIDTLPRTPSGKVDRRALAVRTVAVDEGPVAEPRTPLEELLAGQWCDLLGLSSVGVDDDFFALGGHSLLATRVTARLRSALGVEVPVRRLFEAPTVAQLARVVGDLLADGGPAPVPPPVPRPPGMEEVPLSFAQQRLWFLDRLEPGSAAYNLPGALRLDGPLVVRGVEEALAAITARHESLRTVFVAGGSSDAVQRVLPAEEVPVPLPVIDLAGLGGAAEGEAVRLIRREAERPFDLATAPPWRYRLLRLPATGGVP
ncbi:MAG: AMP-binding protein, partial [Acidobacteria bacterium]|nr:AMP-binding protein [Acidobacteriota bacterium]